MRKLRYNIRVKMIVQLGIINTIGINNNNSNSDDILYPYHRKVKLLFDLTH